MGGVVICSFVGGCCWAFCVWLVILILSVVAIGYTFLPPAAIYTPLDLSGIFLNPFLFFYTVALKGNYGLCIHYVSEHRMSPCKYLDKGQPLKAQYPMGNATADSPGANILPSNSLLVLFQLAVGDITANTASCHLECLSYRMSFYFFCFLVCLLSCLFSERSCKKRRTL